ncbi:hypothetical protein [Bythopirellula polymerisocia]|uniref:Uncharacterized protein n=1 Tax=Bythopirellula polymerisocia TaxID=2528003 RepID=A0A5C6CNI8_9BACT|nr:hypothetical protein [Bythopirellula polymerisocia]TWU24616.1 hypothetical protein Pla144_35010 [Bythopirellula polymerisocia]
MNITTITLAALLGLVAAGLAYSQGWFRQVTPPPKKVSNKAGNSGKI